MAKRNSVRKFAATTLLVASSALYSVQASAGGFNVEVNQSRALKLDEPAAAVMIGNPAIADVTVLGPQLIYVQGRSYGKTNFVALDAKGKQISAFNVNVVAQTESTVTLTRGAGQMTYNCTPRCERVVALGDEASAFQSATQQSMGMTSMARAMSMDGAGQQGGVGTVIGPAANAAPAPAPEQ